MKKRVLSMLMVLVMLASLLSVAAFAADETEAPSGGAETEVQPEVPEVTPEVTPEVPEEPECAHAELAWKAEGAKCWQYCTAEGCDYTVNIGEHADSGDADYACDRCGGHIHSMTAMDFDAGQHWSVCADAACPDAAAGDKAPHTWTLDETNTDETLTKYVCACGAVKTEHVHKWAEEWKFNDTHHWHDCVNAGCTADDASKDAYGEHSWTKDEQQSTATNLVYNCVCGKTKSEHVHVWDTTYKHDGNQHWYVCTDPSCTSVTGGEKHFDYNGDNKCDKSGCGAAMQATVLSTMTITGVTAPVDGTKVDFGVSVSESVYGSPTVTWKRMTKINGSDAKNMTADNTYCAACMYELEIWVPYNRNDPVATDINITVDGVKVPYYTTLNAYVNARSTFEGVNPVYRAHFDTKNGVPTMVINVLYGKVAGTHAHVYGADWVTASDKHYHICVGCDAVKDSANHVDKDNTGLCDVCNYEMGKSSTAAHTCNYGTDWVEDMTSHWKQCTICGTKVQSAKHADLNNTGKCDVCGFVMSAAAGHTHAYGSDWTETFAQHYKLCSCGAKTEIAAHFDNNNSGKCDVCGYVMTANTTGTGTAVPPTGDDNVPMLWLAAMLVSTLGLFGTVLVAKKRRTE